MSSAAPGKRGHETVTKIENRCGLRAVRVTVRTTFETFFNANTPRAVAEGYLEDGANLGPAIKFAAKLQKKEHLTENAKVTKVVFLTATTATVTYDLVGTPLQGATGQAVYQGGKWLVAKNTFCGLVEIGAGATTVPGCSS